MQIKFSVIFGDGIAFFESRCIFVVLKIEENYEYIDSKRQPPQKRQHRPGT